MSHSTLPDVKQLAEALPFDEQLILLEHLARRVRLSAPGRHPQDLFGAFKGRFPEEFDVDEALRDIRTSWKRDLGDPGGESGGTR